MTQYILIGIGALLVIDTLLILRLLGGRKTQVQPLEGRFDALEKGVDKIEKTVIEAITRSREEAGTNARKDREEITSTLQNFLDSLVLRMMEIGNHQKEELDGFTKHLTSLTLGNERAIEALRKNMDTRIAAMQSDLMQNGAVGRDEMLRMLKAFGDMFVTRMNEVAAAQKGQLDSFNAALTSLAEASDRKMESIRETLDQKLAMIHSETRQSDAQSRQELSSTISGFGDTLMARMSEISTFQKEQLALVSSNITTLLGSNERQMDQVRATVEGRLSSLQQDNARRLEEMRETVDEKLHATLERRLGESFKRVSDQLDQVQKGLGEMQMLASGVGDLKRVLVNVRTRGVWGEVQLSGLLDQMLTPEQYASKVAVNPDSVETVDFAVKLPSRDGSGSTVWMPIDAAFPQESYDALLEAQDKGDPTLVEEAARALEDRIRSHARHMKSSFVSPPATTDFSIMFLHSEGLFAEVLRRTGLQESLQRDYRVIIMGPTTFGAILSSLQMGFRTMAIEKRSNEVWSVLGAVKSEFGKFGDVLDRVQQKLNEASNTITTAATHSRVLERKLREVPELPAEETAQLLVEAAAPAVPVEQEIPAAEPAAIAQSAEEHPAPAVEAVAEPSPEVEAVAVPAADVIETAPMADVSPKEEEPAIIWAPVEQTVSTPQVPQIPVSEESIAAAGPDSPTAEPEAEAPQQEPEMVISGE